MKFYSLLIVFLILAGCNTMQSETLSFSIVGDGRSGDPEVELGIQGKAAADIDLVVVDDDGIELDGFQKKTLDGGLVQHALADVVVKEQKATYALKQQIVIDSTANWLFQGDNTFQVTEDAGVYIKINASIEVSNGEQSLTFYNPDISTFSSEAGARVIPRANDVLLYVPPKDFNGVDTFRYLVSAEEGVWVVGVIVFNILPVDDLPLAKTDIIKANQGQAVSFNVLANDAGLGDGLRSVSIASAPAFGAVQMGEGGLVSYTPSGDYFGPDSFSYRVEDINGDLSIASVTINIACLVNCQRVFRLSWDPSVSPDVTKYKLYVGRNPDSLMEAFDVVNNMQYEYVALSKGEYYFAVSAVNNLGIESALSEVQHAVY